MAEFEERWRSEVAGDTVNRFLVDEASGSVEFCPMEAVNSHVLTHPEWVELAGPRCTRTTYSAPR